MVELVGGELYQWDTGRTIVVNPGTDDAIHEVHFTTKNMDYAYVVGTYEQDGAVKCHIPNIILQQTRSIIVYEVTKTETGEMSVSETTLALIKRNKPQDYAYTEDELRDYERIVSLIPTKLSQLEADVEFGTTDYDLLNNKPITNVSSDESNMVAICELESGVYRFTGAFTPYPGSNIYYNFTKNQLVNIISAFVGTHVQAFYPEDNTVQFCAIMKDESAPKGWTVEDKDVCLNDIPALISAVGSLEGLTTTEKSSVVAAINEVSSKIISDYDALDNTPILNITSASDSPLALRDLETGVYRLSGKFVPFSGSYVTISFSNKQLVNVVTKTAGTHIQIFYPINNVVQFVAIMADDTAEGGYTYERTDVNLNDLAELLNKTSMTDDQYTELSGLIV